MLNLSIDASGKGDSWHLDIRAPINGPVADGRTPSGTSPQANVHLECQNCNVGG